MASDPTDAHSAERPPATAAVVHRGHTLSSAEALEALQASVHGLSRTEAAARLERFGANTLPHAHPPHPLSIFLRQFLSPLIYILLLAALVSIALGEWSDAVFISAVLLINATIGALQEYSAQRAAQALQRMVSVRARVLRDGDAYELDAETLVPGDIVALESGSKVPADLRLLSAQGLEVDESLLTGESDPVAKDAAAVLAEDTVAGDRTNMTFAGTLVTRGRARGVVVATGLATELGRIASTVLGRTAVKPPLLVRMARFTTRIAILIGVAVVIMAGVSLAQGAGLEEVFLLSVALAVSAIPEGLPVALTVTLAIGMQRMARRNVIVRKLVAVEALGSCTFIASDKTGTLTVNELTARRLVFAGQQPWVVTGEGMSPEGAVLAPQGEGPPAAPAWALVERACQTAVLTNEGFLGMRDGQWVHHGDGVDVAMLVMAHKVGLTQAEVNSAWPALAELPFESNRLFSANLNRPAGDEAGAGMASVKGAVERLLPMCTTMATPAGDVALDAEAIRERAHALASDGYRVLALASGPLALGPEEVFSEEHLHGLTLIALVGMIDPLRGEAKAAVGACHRAGIEVSMVTGDHPATAFAIARELDLADDMQQVVTGMQLREAEQTGPTAVDALTARARVFARVEPQQKLDIVRSLIRNGHFVAVTGDGANDAPALRAAHVGVAMGRSGTDVARETAELIVTDDNFASIVAGIEEGRIAYANVRKVIFLLISTGAAELVLFTLSLATGLPLPLVAVQLLWLNLVTNGIQDIALAFETAEGDELRRPPRPPREPVFNRLMIERVLISAAVMGCVAFATFAWLLQHGYGVEAARNVTLLLMVLFENVHVFNSRSETRSTFGHDPLRNPLLLFGTAAAQLVHIGAMYTPGLSTVLGLSPVSPLDWLSLLGLALTVLVVMEVHKWLRRRGTGRSDFR